MKLTALDFYKELFEELDPEKLQRKLLQLLLEMQNVERGSLWVRTEAGYLCLEAAGDDSEKVRGLILDRQRPSIVGWVMENGQMTIAEAGKDPRHNYEVEKGFSVKSGLILCYPLLLDTGETYGAVELIETNAGGRLNLSKDYLEILQSLIEMGSIALGNALNYSEKLAENIRLRQTLGETGARDPVVGQSAAFMAVRKKARNYAQTDFPVFITGESGSGKEIVAAEIHRNSRRRDKPFLVQNCSAIPDALLESELFGYRKGAFTGATRDKMGLFEAADQGTVFLDEIGDMPLNLQAKLLRVLQEGEIKPLGDNAVRKVDVRILAATNQDLRAAIAGNRFREDLFFRLSVLPLHLPPLRRRREDIPLLLDHFLSLEARKLGGARPKTISRGAMERLMAYDWPGNIRELENSVKYILATVSGEVVDLGDLPPNIQRPAAPAPGDAPGRGQAAAGGEGAGLLDAFAGLSWVEVERAYVSYLLEKTKWNVTKSAEEARVKRSTFVSRMKRLGIGRD